MARWTVGGQVGGRGSSVCRGQLGAVGCSSSPSGYWVNKLLQLYYEGNELAFNPRDLWHWNFISDPGHHSYKECLVTILYSWETHGGCYPPWQFLMPGKYVTPMDCNLDDDLVPAAAEMKLERVATYRQLQGYSAQLHRTSGGALCIDDFNIPEGAVVRPTTPNERREGNTIVDNDSGERSEVLPLAITRCRLLVLMLDMGSIGTAGVAFAAFKLHKTIWGKWDKIHRLIRDCKLAETHCMQGIFTKTKLWSAYLFGLNNRPFGSGANHPLKQRILELVELTESIDSATFLKYLTRFSRVFNMPCDTRREKQLIFNRILELKSFRQKLGQPKLSNWFAWHKLASEQMDEFWPTKYIFETQLPPQQDPDEAGEFSIAANTDPRAQLSAILQHGGGLQLAYKLMKSGLDTHTRILFFAEQGCWNHYTDEVTNTKTPQDAFNYSLRQCDGGWKSEGHIWETLKLALSTADNLRSMDLPFGESESATKLLMLAWHIVSQRLWSLCSRHNCPPECCAGYKPFLFTV